jgi:hypothetical protein
MDDLWKKVNRVRWKLYEALEGGQPHLADLLAQTAVVEVLNRGRVRKVDVTFLDPETSEPRYSIEFDAGKYRKADEEKIAIALEKLMNEAVKRGELPRAPIVFK